MKSLLALTTVVMLGAALPGLAASQATPPPQTAPPAAKPADVSPIVGKWNGSVDAGQGPMSFVIDIKFDGKKVTGTLTGDQGVLPLNDGLFADNKLSFTISFDTPQGPFAVGFTGTLKDDVITGTADAGQMGQLPFRAERAKDK
jgi:hypothetical protein